MDMASIFGSPSKEEGAGDEGGDAAEQLKALTGWDDETIDALKACFKEWEGEETTEPAGEY